MPVSFPSSLSMEWMNREDWQPARRSEEHTSELQSQSNLVCRLLLEKKKTDEDQGQPPRSARRGEDLQRRRCGRSRRVLLGRDAQQHIERPAARPTSRTAPPKQPALMQSRRVATSSWRRLQGESDGSGKWAEQRCMLIISFAFRTSTIRPCPSGIPPASISCCLFFFFNDRAPPEFSPFPPPDPLPI